MKIETLVSIVSVLITAIIMISQIIIENINKNKELILAKMQHIENYKLGKLHEDREWKYKLTDFMARYKDDIFSNDPNTREKIQKIMIVSFPKNVLIKIFNDMYKISNKEDWNKSLTILKRLNKPTVYIQIVKGFPKEIIDDIGDTLAEGDISYFTNDEYVDKTLTRGDVRYFFKEDKNLAKTVLKDFVDLACNNGYRLNLKLIPMVKNNDRNLKGTIEVWLSPESIKKVTNKNDSCYDELEDLKE